MSKLRSVQLLYSLLKPNGFSPPLDIVSRAISRHPDKHGRHMEYYISLAHPFFPASTEGTRFLMRMFFNPHRRPCYVLALQINLKHTLGISHFIWFSVLLTHTSKVLFPYI